MTLFRTRIVTGIALAMLGGSTIAASGGLAPSAAVGHPKSETPLARAVPAYGAQCGLADSVTFGVTEPGGIYCPEAQPAPKEPAPAWSDDQFRGQGNTSSCEFDGAIGVDAWAGIYYGPVAPGIPWETTIGPDSMCGISYASMVASSCNTSTPLGGCSKDPNWLGAGMFMTERPQLVEWHTVEWHSLTEHAGESRRLILYPDARRVFTFSATTTGPSATVFAGTNGNTGAAEEITESGHKVYRIRARDGYVYWYFGADPSSVTVSGNSVTPMLKGQLWKVAYDTGGSESTWPTTYVGEDAPGTSGWNSIGNGYRGFTLCPDTGTPTTLLPRVKTMYDSAGRKFSYQYNSSGRVTGIAKAKYNGSMWDTVSEAAFTYVSGQLELIQTKQRLSDSGVSLCSYQYFKYDSNGQMAMQFSAEGVRQAAYGKFLPTSSTVLNFEIASEVKSYLDDQYTNYLPALKPYAAAIITYDGNGRVATIISNGLCGCSGGPSGQFNYTYQVPSDYNAGSNGVSTTDGTYDCAGAWYSGTYSKSASRTIIERPDGSYSTIYFDDTGQVLAKVLSAVAPGTTTSAQTYWATVYERDASTRIEKVYSPEAVTGYDHAHGKFSVYSGTTPTGTITKYVYSTDDYLTGRVVSEVRVNEANGSGWALVSATDYVATSTAYQDVGSSNSARIGKPLVSASRIYKTSVTSGTGTSGTDYDETTYSYAYWVSGHSPWAIKSVTTTNPAVATTKNGSGSPTSTIAYVDQTTGKTAFTQSATGRIDFYKYTSDSGALTDKVEDVDGSVTDASSAASAFSLGLPSSASTYFKLRTTYGYDTQSRLTSVTLPSTRKTYTYYTRIADHQAVTVSGPMMTTSGGTDTYTGPVNYSVANQLGKTTGQGVLILGCSTCANTSTTIAGWVSTSGSTAIAAVGGDATLVRFSANEYDSSGTRLNKRRLYTSWSGSPVSEDTSYLYDGLGRPIGVKDPTGTIRRSVFDAKGRAIEQSVGTNDYVSSGQKFSTSGTNDMTTVQKATYIANASSGSYLLGTTRIGSQSLDADGNWSTTGDSRTTSFSYDHRGRVLFTQTPVTPYTLVKYDFRGRVVASAGYSSVASITVGTTDPVGSASGDKAYRTSAAETSYDEMGRVWSTVSHMVVQADGSFSTGNDLVSQSWVDPDGLLIKSMGPAGLSKFTYDRMLRQTRSYSLAKIDDADYAATVAADRGLSNDIVLEEAVTGYDRATGDVLMTASFSRHHDQPDTVTGPLDANADGGAPSDLVVTAADLKHSGTVIARAQISAMWYDDLDRIKESAVLGTYGLNETSGPSAFDRLNDFLVSAVDTPPSRSNTVLRTSTAYNKDGTVSTATDPRGLATKTEYDNAGRRVATISNYTGATPPLSTANRDTDAYVRYVYTNGLMTKMWVDLDGDGTEDTDDQVTQYVYGTSKGTIGSGTAPASAVATGHLLREAIYPPQTSGQTAADRTVYTAYNALSEVVWTRDQNGTALTSTLDNGGRLTDRIVDSLGTSGSASVDGTVRRIGMTYTARGQVEQVVQYDSTSGGTALNGVKYAYDDWGNTTKCEQDRDSAVGGSGSAALAIEWAYARQVPTNGRPRVQRESMTMPGANASTSSPYAGDDRRVKYLTSGTIAGLTGRVDAIRLAAVKGDGTDGLVSSDYVQYQYLGAGTVVGTALLGPARSSNLFNASNLYDEDLDQFNRLKRNRWTVSGTSTDIYHIDLSYDRNSNITQILDPLEKIAGTRVYDTAYTVDGLNRVTSADRGTLSGSAITGSIRNTEAWMLTQTGNWVTDTIDTDGTTGFEFSDTRTHNNVNEILTRSSPSATPVYDKAGEMLDDGANWKYRYDALGRVVEVKNRSTGVVVSEYVYDGLGQRIGWHYDVNASGGGPDDHDPWYWFVYDDRWRIATTYRVAKTATGGAATLRESSAVTDSLPKERFVYHNAGQDGLGSSSYIDSLMLIRRDLNSTWTGAADGSLEAWHYPLMNWRNDTVAVEDEFGGALAGYRYTAYGKRNSTLTVDFDGDGFVDPSFDYDAFVACFEEDDCPEGASADWNHDGLVDMTDYYTFVAAFDGDVDRGGGLRHLYAGYECDPKLDRAETGFGGVSENSVYHIRHRAYLTELGCWIRRDPVGYADGMSLCHYVNDAPVRTRDPSGLETYDECVQACDDDHKWWEWVVVPDKKYNCKESCWRKHNQVAVRLCARPFDVASSTSCKEKTGLVVLNVLGQVHQCVRPNDTDAGVEWMPGMKKDDLPQDERHVADRSVTCQPCWRVSGSTPKTDAEIWECIRKHKGSADFSRTTYNCQHWTGEALASCGVRCGELEAWRDPKPMPIPTR